MTDDCLIGLIKDIKKDNVLVIDPKDIKQIKQLKYIPIEAYNLPIICVAGAPIELGIIDVTVRGEYIAFGYRTDTTFYSMVDWFKNDSEVVKMRQNKPEWLKKIYD